MPATALRPKLALLEFPVALICLWAACFHTPLGALTRDLSARIFGRRSSARPLLAYYSGGEGRPGSVRLHGTVPLDLIRPRRPLDGKLALAFGLRQALRGSPEVERTRVRQRLGLKAAHASNGAWASRLDQLGRKYGSTDAAVLALFAGEAPTRYAIDRARASDDPLELAALVHNLPPGFETQASEAADVLALGTAYGLSWPLDRPTRVNSPFGMRIHPVLGVRKMHRGVDLRASIGTRVHAVGDGVVRRASQDAVNGRLLIVDQGHGVTAIFCHESKLLVGAGEAVKRGEVVSLTGASGRVTGPHLHYQLEIFGKPVDPLAFRPKSAALVPARALAH